jgi:hypothetical protein
VFKPRFQPGTSQIHVGGVTAGANLLDVSLMTAEGRYGLFISIFPIPAALFSESLHVITLLLLERTILFIEGKELDFFDGLLR